MNRPLIAIASAFAALAPGAGNETPKPQWKTAGCSHGHGRKDGERGIDDALKHHRPLTKRDGRRAWHFARCTHTKPQSKRLTVHLRGLREWRRSYPHRYAIRFNRFPNWVHSHLASIAACESHGSPTAVSASGSYRGKYQFSFSTWGVVGGSGDPVAAHEWEQDYRAALLLIQHGAGHWPVCG